MNTARLYEILRDCTVPLRKGPEIVKHGGVTEVFAMPHVDDVEDAEKVDLELIMVGVDKAQAEKHKAELITILDTYPQPKRLAGGPSYIEVGGEIGDQGAAFQLFALGKVLGLWDVVTPTTLGFSGEEARMMAGRGLVMITGYNKSGNEHENGIAEEGKEDTRQMPNP